MGYSSWSDDAFRRVSSGRVGAEVFRDEQTIHPLMDPRGVRAREARDSEHHPQSVPIIVGFDVTASMGDIPTRFAKEQLGALMRRLVEQRWVADPQLLFAAIGDAVSDRAPLQVGQFESGLEMDMWLTRLWLEGRGGDAPESYTLAHWFAAHHTATDAWEKRGKKGYLFTIGDATNKPLEASHVHRVFGSPPNHPTEDTAVLAAAAERWEVFHVLVARNGTPYPDALIQWHGLLGDHLLVLDHVEAVCELIGVVIGLREGALGKADAKGLLHAAGMGPDAIDRATRG